MKIRYILATKVWKLSNLMWCQRENKVVNLIKNDEKNANGMFKNDNEKKLEITHYSKLDTTVPKF